MKVLFVCGAAVFVGLALAEQGRACTRPVSVTPTEPRAVVAEADAAFIGTLVAVTAKEPRSLSSAAPYVFTFAVEEELKGDLGSRVEVTSTLGGASCGHDGTIGRRGAYLLSRRDDVWGPWGLTEVTPETLRRGLFPLPKPDGLGRAAFVAGGRFGLVRTALLDARGRTLAYGTGRGGVTALAVCPGRRVAVELVRIGESVHFALRELAGLRLLNETELRPTGFGEAVICRNRTGSDVLAVVNSYGQSRSTELVRITPLGTKVVEKAPSLAVAVRQARVYVSLSDGSLVIRDLAAGTRRVSTRARLHLTGMSVSPDHRHVAGFSAGKLVVADLARGAVRTKVWNSYPGRTRWTGRRTFAAWSRGSGGLEVLDQSLRTVSPAWTWKTHTATVRGGSLFGVDWTGEFLTQRDGRIVRLGTLFSPAVSVLEPI